jgi:hypothetical protein
MPSLLRREDYEAGWSPLTLDLMIVLVSLSFAGLVSVGLIYAVRKYQSHRASRHTTLPSYQTRNIHDLHVAAPPYYDEKRRHSGSSSPGSGPSSPVPEIRITFPDDVDGQGRQLKGRVVEQLPKYERDGKKWDELDMELMGGLKEKKEFL